MIDKPIGDLNDQQPEIRLIGFGLACDLNNSDQKNITLKSDGGTAGYQLPKVLKQHTVSTKSDIFSVGCVAYELMTGKGLFGNENRAEIQNLNQEWEVKILDQEI